MRKKLSALTIKTLFGLTLLNQSVSALTLNGEKVDFTAKDTNLKKSRAIENDYKTIIVQFNTPLTKEYKEHFYKQGVNSIVYAGDLGYYFYGKRETLDKLSFSSCGFAGKSDMKSIYRYKSEGLSTFSEGGYETFNLLFLQELTKSEVEEYLSKNGIEATVNKALPSLREAEVEIALSDLQKLKNLPLIQYMDKSQHVMITHGKESRNSVTAKKLSVSTLWSNYNLEGENMSIGIVDGGIVRSTHREFNENGISRVINRSKSDTNFHATHVAGTIIADGDNAKARGMADKALLYSYSFTDVAFAEAVLALYRNDGVLLSNHSYGYSDKTALGEYDSEANTQDRAVHNNPFINIFEAAGNDGKESGYAGYGIIKGPGNSKNIFTIGALNINSTKMAELSSTGPVKDGRIKPDLCVRGEYINSTTDESDSSYATMSGTSMATPAATGAAALVMQQYKRTTGGLSDMRHDVLKSILINTAVDKENKGPDYKVGFGMLDAKAAVDSVKTLNSSKALVGIGTISHNEQKVYNFNLNKSGKFKTTISWVDKEANPSSAVTLVNDIDIVLIDRGSGRKYYPYTLDKNHPSALAKRDKPNRVDNIEQIEVDNLPAGSYQLVVKGYKIISSSQEFAIASNVDIFDINTIEVRETNLRCFANTIYNGSL